MCYSVVSESGAKMFLEDCTRRPDWYDDSYLKKTLKSFQHNFTWLMDYEIKDGKLVKKFVATGKPGLEAVEKAINITAVDQDERVLETVS
jgi:hypothetical protein